MSEPIHVPDVQPPLEPRSDVDDLSAYLGERYLARKEELIGMLSQAKDMNDKGTLVELVYEMLLFRLEIEEWLAFAQQVLDEAHGDQLGIAHTEGAEEAAGRGSARPLSKVVEARAAQFTAPLRRAVTELRGTRDWADKVLFWAQAQSKFIRDEEYGSLLEGQSLGSRPKESSVIHPPSAAKGLKRR